MNNKKQTKKKNYTLDDLEKAQAALIAQKDALKKSILDSSLNKENK